MWQLYYRIDESKTIEEFATRALLDVRAQELSNEFMDSETLYIEIIDPDGTFAQRVTK